MTIKKFLKKVPLAAKIVLTIPGALLLLFIAYSSCFISRIYPNISIAGQPVGGKTPAEAARILPGIFKPPETILLVAESQTFEIQTSKIGVEYDFTRSAERAYGFARTGNIFTDFVDKIHLLFGKIDLGLAITIDEPKITEVLSAIAGQVEVDPTPFSIGLKNGTVTVNPGVPGTRLNFDEIRAQIGYNLAFDKDIPTFLTTSPAGSSLSETETQTLTFRAEKFIGKNLTLNFESQSFSYKDADLILLLNSNGQFDEEKVAQIVSAAAAKINRDPQNSLFTFDGGRVKEFSPSEDGVKVDQDLLADQIVAALNKLEATSETNVSITIPVTKTPPQIKTGDVNNLGIKELIGRGTSHFAHSITNRIYNISLAASKFKGVLIAPGATLSFNDTIGDVSDLSGYKQAYIIKDGRTILGDGGGVCQVSTTLFRAALNAGLPITERAAHAYRVGYYEQDSPPGLDATVYSPSPDLKIKNDTPGYILIQPTVNTKSAMLTFDIYGTSDGRKAETSKPVVTDSVAPPPDLYQDDPTLPAGQIKQIDYAAWGAKVTFNYTVTRAGETIYKKTFVSNYRPWQAVYLKGTGN
jgi:vancomycin resistance protein YoaR